MDVLSVGRWGCSPFEYIVTIYLVDEKKKKLCENAGLDSLLNLSKMPHVKVQGLAMAIINNLVEAGKLGIK